MRITNATLVTWGASPRVPTDHALHISGDRIDVSCAGTRALEKAVEAL